MTNESNFAEQAQREGGTFWRDVFTWHRNVAPIVLPRVMLFVGFAFLVSLTHRYVGWERSETSIVEVTGAFLALLLVLRTNAGYNRWWEARQLWSGIINQSRAMVIAGLSFGPKDSAWQSRFVSLAIAFVHSARRTLRDERALPEVSLILGEQETAAISAAPHMPSHVSHSLARMLRRALDTAAISAPGFRQADFPRAAMLDHLGGCERVRATRFPLVHRSMLGQLIVLYLLAFPFLVVSAGFFSEALLTAAVAYPLLALDQIARELGNPFSPRNRSHFPLDEMTESLAAELVDLRDEAARHVPAPAADAATGPAS